MEPPGPFAEAGSSRIGLISIKGIRRAVRIRTMVERFFPRLNIYTQIRPTLRQYLAGLQPPLSNLLPPLIDKGMDDNTLHAMLTRQLEPYQQEKVLEMLVKEGVMTRVQKVLFESGMRRFQSN